MSGQAMDYKEEVLRELGDLSKERVDEVIDFIGYLRSKDIKRRENDKSVTKMKRV